ncbi:MAG: Ldh family oxidoreductase [Chloroflexia bacterium]|nr:Ldh family oxidoreductase [Chloroflexia bacterium]
MAVDGFGTGRFAASELTRFTGAVLEHVGVPPTRAVRAAETLTLADLRGVSSHGVARLGYYVSHIEQGTVDPASSLQVVRETASTIVFDAHDGLGIALAPEAMDACIVRAETSGVAFCTVRHSSHFGIGAAYVIPAARRGLGALAMTNAGPLVVPTGGGVAMLGTNPIAFAVPVGNGEPPLVLDMATSTVAWGKIEIARRAGKSIPAGWALDETGAATTDPFAARWLTPLGGDEDGAGHKGYGLATVVDVLCGPLAGALWGTHLASVQRPGLRPGLGHCFLAWRIDAFRDPAEFGHDLRQLLAELRATPPGTDRQGVLAPGDPEIAAEVRHGADGIALDAQVIADLEHLAARLGISPPRSEPVRGRLTPVPGQSGDRVERRPSTRTNTSGDTESE